MSTLKPYPSYRDSGLPWLGQVPAHWEVKRLKHVTNVTFSSVDKHTHENEKPVSLCNYVDVYKNESITSDFEFMQATATAEEFRRFTLKKNDVMITKDSESWNDIAIPAYVPNDLENVICGYHLALVRPKSEIDGKFLFRALQAGPINYQFEVEATGITRYGIDQYAIGSTFFVLPPLPEQQTIAAYLDRATARIDALIAREQRLLELLAERRLALINQAVTKGLNPDVKMKNSGVEWLGQVPEHWEVKKLKYVGKAIIGLTYSPDDVTDSENGTLVLRASNVYDEHISFDDNVFVKKKIPAELITKVGDILICVRSGSRDLIGKNTLINKKAVNLTFGAFMTVFRSAINNFVSYVFKSRLFKFQSGLFNTSTVNQLTKSVLYNFQVAIPQIDEQNQIVEYLHLETEIIQELKTKTETAIERLREYRSALISSVVTGKICVCKR